MVRTRGRLAGRDVKVQVEPLSLKRHGTFRCNRCHGTSHLNQIPKKFTFHPGLPDSPRNVRGSPPIYRFAPKVDLGGNEFRV